MAILQEWPNLLCFGSVEDSSACPTTNQRKETNLYCLSMVFIYSEGEGGPATENSCPDKHLGLLAPDFFKVSLGLSIRLDISLRFLNGNSKIGKEAG